jgi:hypothetical protein
VVGLVALEVSELEVDGVGVGIDVGDEVVLLGQAPLHFVALVDVLAVDVVHGVDQEPVLALLLDFVVRDQLVVLLFRVRVEDLSIEVVVLPNVKCAYFSKEPSP